MASHPAFLQILNSPHHPVATIKFSGHKLSPDAFSQKPIYYDQDTNGCLIMAAEKKSFCARSWGVIVANGDERGGESLISQNSDSYNQVSSEWCGHWHPQAGNPASQELLPSVLWTLGSQVPGCGLLPTRF